jgi:hypothetical protein
MSPSARKAFRRLDIEATLAEVIVAALYQAEMIREYGTADPDPDADALRCRSLDAAVMSLVTAHAALVGSGEAREWHEHASRQVLRAVHWT